MKISVVVPSYNRGRLLPITLPTYIQQEDVLELILVDDCSSDNTYEIVLELQKQYPCIRYFRNEINSKQTYSKNVGIFEAKGDYIYFGDDDSVLQPGSLAFLKKTILAEHAQICGAKALYLPMEYKGRIDEYVRKMDVLLPTGKKLADIENLRANFTYSTMHPVALPFCHASALVQTELAKKVLFDVNYIGNAFREETDFFIRCSLSGAKIVYDSRAVQVNLPREISTGGAHAGGRIRWYISSVQNNWYFLKKNWKAIQQKYGCRKGKWRVHIEFVVVMLRAGIINCWRLLYK